MTVEDLIEILHRQEPDTPVWIEDDGILRDPYPYWKRDYQYGERDDDAKWKLVL